MCSIQKSEFLNKKCILNKKVYFEQKIYFEQKSVFWTKNLFWTNKIVFWTKKMYFECFCLYFLYCWIPFPLMVIFLLIMTFWKCPNIEKLKNVKLVKTHFKQIKTQTTTGKKTPAATHFQELWNTVSCKTSHFIHFEAPRVLKTAPACISIILEVVESKFQSNLIIFDIFWSYLQSCLINTVKRCFKYY